MTDQPSHAAADVAADQEDPQDPTALESPESPESSDPSDHPGPGTEPAYEPTGVPEVDALATVLEDLDVLPIEDHAQVYAEAHQRLHQALLSADEE